MPRDQPAAHDPAHREGRNPDRAVDDAHLRGGERQPALVARVQQERRHHLDELGLAQAVEQEEEHDHRHARPPEERAERGEERTIELDDLRSAELASRPARTIGRGTRQHEAVPQAEEQEQPGEDAQGDAPRESHVPRARLERAGEDDQQPLPGDGGDAVEQAADADEERLLLLGLRQDVEAVGRDVVSG